MRSVFVAAGIFAVSVLAGPTQKGASPPPPPSYQSPAPPAPPAPAPPSGGPAPSNGPAACPPCMTQVQAQQVANNFAGLIDNYSNAAADAVLTENFQDYSDSVSELINSGCPNGPATLGQATFSSRAAFEAGQGTQPNIPFNILNLWHTCDTVAIRWRTTVAPNATEFVTGIIVLETTYQNNPAQPFLINTVYSEFNSGAWLVDLGVFKPTCNSAPAPSKRGVLALPHRIA